jgi:NAD-dependent SIR2 family protein deacetylase
LLRVGAKRAPLGFGRKGGKMADAYCVKCKEKRDIKEPEEVVMKNGMKAMKGTCEKCGTKVFKILGKA